ncbi:hypothetical protein EP331_08330, partial [bacterium]
VGCRMSDVGCRMSDVGCRMSDVGCRMSDFRNFCLLMEIFFDSKNLKSECRKLTTVFPLHLFKRFFQIFD